LTRFLSVPKVTIGVRFGELVAVSTMGSGVVLPTMFCVSDGLEVLGVEAVFDMAAVMQNKSGVQSTTIETPCKSVDTRFFATDM
jgi:hypothetical protein